MKLTNESKTLFIPLLGKAAMSKANLFLNDPKAEEIISNCKLISKQSKWLSMYMSLRALIIDDLCNNYLSKNPNTIIIHLGCGLDSRCLRVNKNYKAWYDLDYKEVISIRKKFYKENNYYKMIGSSVMNFNWLEQIKEKTNVMIVAEGLTMYLNEQEIKELLSKINERFENVHLLFDAYTKKGVRSSKYKNPVNQLDAKIVYGIDTPKDFYH